MEQTVITVLSLVLGFFGSGGAIITWLLYGKQEKRMRNAEIVEKEISSLRSTITTLEGNQKFLADSVDRVQRLLSEKDSYIKIISKEKNVLDIKHSKNKGALNQAYSCKFHSVDEQCPVIKARMANEQEYLDMLKNQEDIND